MVQLMLLFLGLVVAIAFVHKKSWETVLRVSHRISGKPHIGIWLYAIVFFPGTLIHELSHLFMAEILHAKTKEVTLFPKREENYIQLGSVQIQKVDPFRGVLIGIAPFLVGIIAISSITLIQFTSLRSVSLSVQNVLGNFYQQLHIPLTWFALYIIITISHSMFLSEEDKKEIFIIPVILVFTGTIIYVLKDFLTISEHVMQFIIRLFTLLDLSLLVVLVFNLLFLFVLVLLRKMFETIF